eukprot:GHVU01017499.1.p2 GENE.GHVU01017499.1~~GHVU01017499.1.p2  ORF type:complete len:145 (+),score=9.32 GHVU01017499.1:435-869(+)
MTVFPISRAAIRICHLSFSSSLESRGDRIQYSESSRLLRYLLNGKFKLTSLSTTCLRPFPPIVPEEEASGAAAVVGLRGSAAAAPLSERVSPPLSPFPLQRRPGRIYARMYIYTHGGRDAPVFIAVHHIQFISMHHVQLMDRWR